MIKKDEALEILAENVSSLLAAKKLGTRELARLSENEPMTISRLVHKKCLPTVDALYRLANALGVSLDDLLKRASQS